MGKRFFSYRSKSNFYSSDYSKAYLRHLIINKEILGSQIASFHNLNFYLWLVKEAREKIIKGTFEDWKKSMIIKLNNKL